MKNTHLAAELARRETRQRPARRKRAGEDSLALLLAALNGNSRPALPSRSTKIEASRESTMRETPVANRQASPRSVPASALANRPTVAASKQVPVSVREVASTVQGAESISAAQDSTCEQEVFGAGISVQRENEVRDETAQGQSGEALGRCASPDRSEYPYPEWFAGETPRPSFEMAWEPPQEVPSAASQPDQLRGELRTELQELLRAQTGRAAEERASASHAMSRARLASYR